MDPYALHLAMAALVGASFVAVSAYYMHRKTLTQLLEFARAVERERDRDRADDEDQKNNPSKRAQGQYSKKGAGYYHGGSVSMPDVMMAAAAADVDGEVEEVERLLMNGQLVDMGIPPGLPRLHTVVEGNYLLDRFLSELVMD